MFVTRPKINIAEYKPINLVKIVGVNLVGYIGKPPYSDKVVHIISPVDKAPSLANFEKFKTFVSSGPKPFLSFMVKDEKTGEYNHTDIRFKLNEELNGIKLSYDLLQSDIDKNKAHSKSSHDEVNDQREFAKKANTAYANLYDQEVLEERLRNEPDFIVNLIPQYPSEEMKTILQNNYFVKSAHKIEVYKQEDLKTYKTEGQKIDKAEELKMDYVNMLTELMIFIDRDKTNGIIIESPERKIGLVMNGLLPDSLGLVSFVKSVYPDINLLIVVAPPKPEEMEQARGPLESAYKYLFDKFNIIKTDIINKNARSKIVDKIEEKIKYLLKLT